jgi:hypothetical protein
VINSMTIQPGDSITASVTYITSGTYAGDFQLSIDDTSRSNDSFTTYQSSSATQSPLAKRTSAEWIVEAPTVGSGVSTIDDFGSVTFTNATATINGVTGPINDSAWQNQAINIAVGSTTYDTTSVLVSSGTSFVETYNTSAAAIQGLGGSRSRSASALGSNPLGKKTASVLVIAPGWTGASSVLAASRTPIRQQKPAAQAFSTGRLFDT